MKAFPPKLSRIRRSPPFDIVTETTWPRRVAKVTSGPRPVGGHPRGPTKYDPRSKETADHSLPYVIAAAVADRQVTPCNSPREDHGPPIRAQLRKVEVIADPEIEKLFPALQRVDVEIDTVDGRAFSTRLDYPKGDPRNPLTDVEIEGKFDALAEPVLTESGADRLKEAVWSLESQESVSGLLALTESDR